MRRTQRSIRRLKPDPVDDALIMKLLELALKAPSGGNRQNAEFVVVRDPAVKRGLGRLNRVAWGMYGRIWKFFARNDAKTLRAMKAVDWEADHYAEIPVLIVACLRWTAYGPIVSGWRPPFPPFLAGIYYGSIFPAVAKSAAWSPSGGPRCCADGHASVERLARTSRSRPAVVGVSGGGHPDWLGRAAHGRDRPRRTRLRHESLTHRRPCGVPGGPLPVQPRECRHAPERPHPVCQPQPAAGLGPERRAAVRKRDSHLAARTRRLVKRRGDQKAIVAVARSILVIAPSAPRRRVV
jgi:nitroreductase